MGVKGLRQLNNGYQKAISIIYKLSYFAKKSTFDVVIYRPNIIQKKISFLASLLDDHVSPRILAAEVRTLRWATYLGQYKKMRFTDSPSFLLIWDGNVYVQ